MPLEKFPRITLPERIALRRRVSRINRTYTLRAIAVMLLVITAATCLWIFFTSARAEEYTPTTTMYVCTESDPLNVRESPSLHSKVVALLQRGEAVEVVRMERGWALIRGAGEAGEGWVSARYLADKSPAKGPLEFAVEDD